MPALSTIALRDVSYSYGSHAEPLFSGLTTRFPAGFTGIVGPNGAGKTTLLRVIVGELTPSGGVREGPRSAAYCAQRTDTPPPDFQSFLDDWDPEPCLLKSRLGVDYDYLERWHLLSHGQRKRAQIAHALWQSPAVLAIDEPTNHIDAAARQVLIDALRDFRGVGIVVSHDRTLLDELCQRCLWLESSMARIYQGGISHAQQQRQEEREASLHKRNSLLAQRQRLNQAVVARRDRASKEHALRSRKALHRKDSDAREKINRARVTDGNAGSGLRQVDGRLAQLEGELATLRTEKERRAGIWLDGAASPRDAVLRLSAGQLSHADGGVLMWPDVYLRPRDRIAIMGGNGVGKSRWINHVLPKLNAPRDHVVYLPQELTAAQARAIHQSCVALPPERLGQVMSIVSCLNSRPAQLLASRQPSPGETRKLALALGMERQPHIIIMDEPTNHLDLPSIQALEQALADCPCAFMVVSHDRRFVENIGAEVWNIEEDGQGTATLVI